VGLVVVDGRRAQSIGATLLEVSGRSWSRARGGGETQSPATVLTGREPGTHQYVGVLTNAAGVPGAAQAAGTSARITHRHLAIRRSRTKPSCA